jgi:ketosteroid isomerase-like protein
LRKLANSILLFSLVLLAVALASAADRNADVLLQADRDFAKATAEKGVDGWMSYMAPGAVLLGTQPKITPEAIRATMTEELQPGAHLTWEPTKAEFIGDGNIGYTIGRFEFSATDKDGKTMNFKGTYMTIWQGQKDGSWKVIADVGSPDKPH